MPKIVQIQGDQNTLYDLDNRYIELSATSGTLTEEQLATLQASSKNYIIHNNFIYSKTGENNDYLWYSFEDIGLEHFYFYTINKGTGAFGFTTKTYTEKASPATAGNLAELTSGGNIADSGIAASDIQKSITKEVENDPDNSSFDITISDGQDAPLLSTVIKGKTAAVNQLVQNGNFANGTTGWSKNSTATYSAANNVLTFTTSGTSSGHRIYRDLQGINGHTYYVSMTVKCSVSKPVLIALSPSNSVYTFPVQATVGSTWTTVSGIITLTEDTAVVIIRIAESTDGGVTLDITNVMTKDLTAEGYTAAETTDVATFKAAFLRKNGFPLPQYIPYDAGSLKNVDGEYLMHGKNLATRIFGYNNLPNTNTITAQSGYSMWIAPVIYGKQYTFTTDDSAAIVYGFFSSKPQVGSVCIGSRIVEAKATTKTFTSPITGWVAFRANADYTKGQCELGETATAYEPYFNGGTIDCSGAPLNGFDDTVCDEKDYATGKRITRFPLVDLGTLNWSFNSSQNRFFAQLSLAKNENAWNTCRSVNPIYEIGAVSSGGTNDKVLGIYDATIYVRDSSYSDAATFKAAMSGVMLGYELATPTTSTETPQPLETQYGYNVLEPVNGGVQSGEVKIRYISDKGTSEIIDYVDNAISTSILGAINTTY